VVGSQVPQTTSDAIQILGWGAAATAPANPSEADSSIPQHDNAGAFAASVASARGSAYATWASLAKPPPTQPTPSGTPPTTSTAPAPTAACTSGTAITGKRWDYVVVGAGAGGIPVAEKIAATGKSVLLIEKGPPSSGRWGGSRKPAWLQGTNLTRFDVPGLDNQIWADSAGIACTDVAVMSGCVLGGGTAVNAGLWWKPNPADFDYNFPQGWKGQDLQAAVGRAFARVPFTDHPSTDGRIYQPEGYDVITGALAARGWQNVTAGNSPDKKNFTFSRPNHMFSHGERGGPLATYLVSASNRQNFKLITNTSVTRITRNGRHATGVEVEAFLDGGVCGKILTENVILSAGAFGSPKILFRSGIGPQDQLEIVSRAEGGKMISKEQWINLPVGQNLDDHASTDIVVTHPNITTYDFYAAYDNPIEADKKLYLEKRSGILAQSAPNIVAAFWQEFKGTDGIVRQLHYTARVEASQGVDSDKAISISQYLGRGSVGRGRTTITAALNMVVSEVPYLKTEQDVAAVKKGLESIISTLGADPAIKVVAPPAGQTIDQYLANYGLTTGKRTANHWMGTCKMGLDSGQNGGTAVVDTDTKVYGTDNIFVVDASVFPGMVTTNPSSHIVSMAEHASEKIIRARDG
jgi:cellobiose dehydrogenase (acceptor)